VELAGLARFIHRIGRLKQVPRTGWLDRGVPPSTTESVADHTFRVALLAWVAAKKVPGLDVDRVLKLALIHDLAEAVTGDLPPYDPTELATTELTERARLLNRRHIRSDAQIAAKRIAESRAMTSLLADLSGEAADELATLWREFEDGVSPEVRFVKQVDKLETYLQSREYLAAQPTLPIESFAAEVIEVIDSPELVTLRDAIRDMDVSVSDSGSPTHSFDPG
jgi:putative hydrolase of HD superfamily